jgi:hypothetical protein
MLWCSNSSYDVVHMLSHHTHFLYVFSLAPAFGIENLSVRAVSHNVAFVQWDIPDSVCGTQVHILSTFTSE